MTPSDVTHPTKHALLFKPQGMNRVYAITLQGVEKLQYTIEIRYTHSNENGHYFEIARSPVKIGNSSGYPLLVQGLSAACGQTLYPFCLVVNRRGEILGPQGYESMLKRWQEVRDQLAQTYCDEAAERYIAHTDAVFKNPLWLMRFLDAEWFFAVFFAKVYTHYEQGRHQLTGAYPVLGFKKNVNYSIDQTLAIHPGRIVIQQKGSIENHPMAEPLFPELYTPDDPPEKITGGSMEATYALNPKNNFIDTM